MTHNVLHYINNRFVPSVGGETFDVLTPLTNDIIGQCASGQSADIDSSVLAASTAFASGVWSKMPVQERARRVRHIGDLILKYANEIAELEIEDTGIPRRQVAKG